MELYALGANGMASDYYPNNSSLIQVGEDVTWYLGVGNQMGSMQLVDIRVKLGNQTILPPNDTTSQPSPAPQFAELTQFLADNGTWEIPFIWKILNFTTQQGLSRILQLEINNVTYTLQNAPACSGTASCRLRFIFELWTWNVAIDGFQFGWTDESQQRIAWLQLWFDISPGVH